MRHVVPSIAIRFNVLTVMRVVMRLLLPINESHSVHIIILMMIILVSSHDQLFLRSFQTDGTHRLSPIARNIDISHILIALLSNPKVIIRHYVW